MCQSLFFKKVAGLLEILPNSQENIYARAYFNFIKKETLAQVFSCEFCKISKSNFSTEHLQTTATEDFTSCWDCKCVEKGKPRLGFNYILIWKKNLVVWQ